MAHETALDVEIDVFEQPETPGFPRRPNVVSRRGHRVKFNVCIREVPDETNWVTIAAQVFTYGPERLGEASHVSRSRRLWGRVLGKAFEIKPDELPCTVSIVVAESGDEHLGQGPYEAVITVSPSTNEPENPEQVTEGDDFTIEFVSM